MNEVAGSFAGQMRSMTADDLRQVWEWRNHPTVRSCMFSPDPISWEQHVAWFERCSADPARSLLIYENPAGMAGFVRFSLVAMAGGVADWSFHVNPLLAVMQRRGLGEAALQHAFVVLGLHKVCGQVLASNSRSLAFHSRLGFIREGVLREQHRVESGWADVHCFGMLRSDYLRLATGDIAEMSKT